MKPVVNPRKLAILNFAKSQGSLEGRVSLAELDRLHEFQQPGAALSEVKFHALGEMQGTASGALAPWVRLSASTRLTLVCQRCLGPV